MSETRAQDGQARRRWLWSVLRTPLVIIGALLITVSLIGAVLGLERDVAWWEVVLRCGGLVMFGYLIGDRRG